MDKVRFGRALGYGARDAMKAAMSAAQAATATDPSASGGRTAPRPAVQAQPEPRIFPSPVPSSNPVVSANRSVRASQVKQAGRSFFTPLKQFSNSLFHQVFGTVFAIFALALAQAVWRMRAAFHGPHNSPEAYRLYLTVAMFLLFAWFTISSFVKGSRAARG